MNSTNADTAEQEVIDSVRRAREEEVRFFCCAAKPERERWVVHEFLMRLGLKFFDRELNSEVGDSPVDVTFRSARFQIKEISDPAQRRHAEIKESLQRAQKATTVRDLVGPVTARDIVLADVSKLLFEIAATSKYSPRVKSDLDLPSTSLRLTQVSTSLIVLPLTSSNRSVGVRSRVCSARSHFFL